MLPSDRIVAVFPVGDARASSLVALCRELYRGQLMVWRELAEGYAALQAAWCRELSLGDEKILIQFNPTRAANSEARLDETYLTSRPCFLCPGNLPREQRALLYRQEYLVLCNPRPIFVPHFTVAHGEHLPQNMGLSLTIFLALAVDLAPSFHVFYNGPHCGASAPDHLHFQIYPRGVLPVDALMYEGDAVSAVQRDGVSLTLLTMEGRAALRISGGETGAVAAAIERCLKLLALRAGGDGEPMVNVIGGYHDGKWSLLVFPRRKGRPEIYHRSEEERMIISPGAVEMGGMIVTVTEKDFAILNGPMVREIYTEISLDEETLLEVLRCL